MIPRVLLYLIFVSFLVLSIISLVSASGVDHYSAGDYEGAIEAFTQELESVSGAEQAPLLNNIGTCYVSLGKADEAISYYSQAVDADPSYARGWINLGVVQEKTGKTDEALTSYDNVPVADTVMYAEAMVKKGSLLAALGELDEALSAFNLAKPGANGTTVVELYTGIGAVEFLKKNGDAADEAFQKAIDADPEGAALAYTNLGVLRISQGKNDEAKELFEKAVANDKSGQTNAAEYLKKLEGMENSESTVTPIQTPVPTIEQQSDKATLGEKNAAKKALSYLEYSAFSKEGLIKQLEYEGFSNNEAEYGVEQSYADWNEQAALMAKKYLDYSSFSRDGLRKQLEYEGFTPQQAEYGVKSVGY